MVLSFSSLIVFNSSTVSLYLLAKLNNVLIQRESFDSLFAYEVLIVKLKQSFIHGYHAILEGRLHGCLDLVSLIIADIGFDGDCSFENFSKNQSVKASLARSIRSMELIGSCSIVY